MKPRGVVIRWAFAWLVLACALLLAKPARANHGNLYDLGSLAYLSDAVVQVRQSASQEGANATRFDVTKVYAGSVKVGDVLDMSAYAFEGEGPIVLFLEKASEPAEPRRLVYAGMRIVVGGHVKRFVMGGRLGQDWETVPQNRDPLEPTSTAPPGVDFATFEGDLVAAVARAAQARALLADPKASDQAIAALFARPELERTMVSIRSRHFTDEVAMAAVKKLSSAGKVDALVDVYLALPGSIRIQAEGQLDAGAVLTVVRDERAPPLRRAAATRALAGHADRFDLAVLEELLSSPEVEVRRAAVKFGPRRLDRDEPMRRLLAKRFARETDELIRYEIAGLMRLFYHSTDRLSGAAAPEPLVAIDRGGRLVGARWISLTKKEWEVRALTVAVTKDGSPHAVSKPTEPLASSEYNQGRATELVLPRDTFALPGHYELTAELELADGDGRTSRKQVLAPIDVAAAPPAPAASASPAAAPSASPSASADASTSTGCACRAAASAPTHGPALGCAWALALMGAAYARRRRRAQPPPRPVACATRPNTTSRASRLDCAFATPRSNR